MKYFVIEDESNNSRLELSEFDNGNEVKEYHMMIHIIHPELCYTDQLLKLHKVYKNFIAKELKAAKPVFKRYFLSDAANQENILSDYIANDSDTCAISIIEQPPLDGSKIAVWIYLQTNVQISYIKEGLFEVTHNNYRHLWAANISSCKDLIDSGFQTLSLLKKYIRYLTEHGYNIAKNCVRTWLFVNNIDLNYAGMAAFRNDVFENNGLNKATHYIASTGICGRSADQYKSVQMDAYAIDGLNEGQIQYLYAPTHLNRTHDYGVSFERGTSIHYGDRQQVFISGTASIDNKGKVVWPGDVRSQTYRMWENVEMLLKEAECDFGDVAKIIVYLRDPADYIIVRRLFDEKFSKIPKVILHASVCRPEWLIEMECIAYSAKTNKEYPAF